MPNETIGRTIAVAVGVCVVCSVFVSTAAVCLKERQKENKTLERNRNILIAADLLGEEERAGKEEVARRFAEGIESLWIDFKEEDFVDAAKVPKECLDERKAAKDPRRSEQIRNDDAGIRQKARYRQIYFTRKGDGIDRIILPVHGKGLWSTMYGFLALGSDRTTIKSFGFYEHGETPGLGGEVDNPRWKAKWVGKKAFDDGMPKITVIKGKAKPGALYEVDGLSGATLTARGVDHLVRFWLGEEGYGPYLKKLPEGDSDG